MWLKNTKMEWNDILTFWLKWTLNCQYCLNTVFFCFPPFRFPRSVVSRPECVVRFKLIFSFLSTQLQMYSVIQFSDKDGGTVSIVNNRWFTPRRCEVFWPPVKGSKAYERILGADKTPDEKWKIYSVQRVFCETGMYNLIFFTNHFDLVLGTYV